MIQGHLEVKLPTILGSWGQSVFVSQVPTTCQFVIGSVCHPWRPRSSLHSCPIYYTVYTIDPCIWKLLPPPCAVLVISIFGSLEFRHFFSRSRHAARHLRSHWKLLQACTVCSLLGNSVCVPFSLGTYHQARCRNPGEEKLEDLQQGPWVKLISGKTRKIKVFQEFMSNAFQHPMTWRP